MAQFKQTSSAKKGGLFVGKSHAEGGIPAIVTDTGQPIEVEGGEAIINKKATALHWEELSKINQSAGGGVPIPPPDDADKVLEKFEQGGKITVKEKKLVFDKWRKLVNMTYTELSRYYHSKDGQTSGLTESEAKSQGISSGRESAEWILKMKKTNWRKWSDDMWKWANKQISFISRMSGMQGDLTDEKGKKTPKYKALLIWGNDPKKKNAHKFTTGGSIQPISCIDFIKNSEAIKNNGYYFEFKNLLLSLGAYDIEVPQIDSLVLITYNSGGQENLKAIDTINSVGLANNLAKLLEVDIALARIIVYDQTVKSKRFHTNLLDSINNKNIVIVDRDTIVCTNIDSDVFFKTGGSTSTAEAIKGLKAMLQFSDDDEKAEILAQIEALKNSDSKSNQEYIDYLVDFAMVDGVELHRLYSFLAKNEVPTGLLPEEIRLNPEYRKLKSDWEKAKKKPFPKFKYPKNRDRVQEFKDHKIAQSIIDKKIQEVINSESQTEKFKNGNIIKSVKQKQLEIINNTNPAPNEYNTWIRKVEDIKTAEEVFSIAFKEGAMYPDFQTEDMTKALESGYITIFSSYPIKQGVFVTPSKMNALDYTGGKAEKIFSKKVELKDIAWIDESEGQYAPTETFNDGGKLIKRADGSYSQRGLWDNIRDNAGSGKEPTKEMLEQEAKIKQKYHLGGDMSKHLAPNGQPSKLTHEQWHLVRTPEFKAWFGDWENDPENSSKVVDSNGEPMVVWHTTSNEFNVFSKIKSRDGFFFAPQKDRLNVYGKSKLNSYFLNLRNPSHEMFKRDLKYLKPKGYDGVMDYGHAKHLGNESLYEIIAFNPNQIKLADGTNTTFDENNPDIRFELGGIFHGSPYQFDKFTTSKMGSGIGQQEDGWGLYLTDDKEGAKNYGKYIYETTLFKNKTPNEYNFLELKKPVPKKLVDKIVEAIQKKSVTNYSVSELISFDYSGYLFYKTLSRMLGGDKNASLFLLDNGVDGLKSSFFNAKGVTYRNDYVIFDENAITIENTEYLPNNYYEDGGAVKSTSPDLYENKLLQIRVIGSENNYYKRVNQEWNFLTPDEIEKLKNGTKHELEHTATIEAIKRRDIPNEIVATFIAYDHLNEDPNYYQKLDKAIPEQMARGKKIDIPVVFKQTIGDFKIWIEEVFMENKEVRYGGEIYFKDLILQIFPAVASDLEELKKTMRNYIDRVKITANKNAKNIIFIDGKTNKVSETIYNYVLSKSLKQKAKTYTYALTIRPFDIGTYPKQNFIRFVEEEPDYKYGLLAYSEPLDDTAIQHYSLAPVSEILQYDGITLDYYEGNFAKVKIERDSYNTPTLIVDFYDKESNEKTHSLELTAKQFREKINSGDWKVINNPNQAKMINKKESLRYFVENQQSAGMLSSGTDLKKYDDIDILRSIMLQIIRDEEGVRNEYTIPYSVEELNSVKDQALIEFKKRPTIKPKTIIETKPESIAEIPAEPIIEENKETKMEEKNQEIVGAVSKWNEVPVRWRNVKAVRPITFNLNPYDKNLNAIVKNFLDKDPLRPVMSVMHFADSGVVCTDAHKLLHIHYKNSDFKGNYATENTLKAYKYYKDEVKTIADADLKVKNDKFPNWEAVIPKESNFVYQIDTMKLYQYLQVAINYANPVTNQVVFKFDKNKQIGFNGKFMIQCLEAMMKMQNCPKLYLHLTEPSRSMLISYEKSITPTGNTYCLSMPVILRNSANIQLYGSADIDNNKYLTCYFDFEDNQIHNGDGSIADYQESYGDANAMPLALITMMDRAIKIAKPKLQILENVCVDGNGIRVYNFNSFIEIANDWGLENGLYYVKNNALVKNTFGSIDDYPKLENRVSTSNPKFTIDSDVFKFYLEKASQNTGNDDLRPVMKSIFFQYDRMPSLDIVATDAITLFRGSLTKYAKNLPDEKFDFMMGEVKQLMNFVKNIDSKEISISVEDKRYRIDAGRLHFEAKLEDGKFPNWQSVVPNSFNKELIFDVKDLYVCMNNEASKMFAKETQLKADEINIFNQNNKVYISNQPNEAKDIKQVSTEICELKIENKIFDESKMFSSSENFILLMPNSSTNGNYFNFKMSALNKVISTIGKEKVIVPYSDLNRAYIFTSDNLNYKTSDVYKPAKITAPTPAVKTPRKSENIAKPKLKGIPAKFKVGDYVLVNYGEEYGKSGFITKVMSYEQYPKSFKPDDSPMYEITGTSKNIPEDNIEISVKPTVTKETPKFTPEVIKIMPKHQLSVLRANDFSEMETAINVLNMAVARVPKLYGQDGIKDKVIYLHYFYGNQDWYVAEMDKSTGECFGYADLGYGAELGYMSIPEFVNNGKVELDFYFEPKTWSKINKGKDSAFEKQTKAVKTPAKATEKVMGTEYTVGTKAHAKAVAQKKQFDDLQKSESGTKDDTQDIKNAIKGLEAFLFSFGATKTKANLKESLDVQSAIKGLKALLK